MSQFEEFEKWLEKHPGRYTIPALQMGWKAALEWVLEVLEFNDILNARIKEELKDTK